MQLAIRCVTTMRCTNLHFTYLLVCCTQACIDDNLAMVRFLVEHGADVEASDNEGWTALHATASCGFMDIARYRATAPHLTY